MIGYLGRQIGEPQPQLGPLGQPQIIGGPCPENQAHLNGICRDIPAAGLTKCGVVNIEFNNYMTFENEDLPSSQNATDSENTNQRRRRRSLRGPSLTRIIGGEDSAASRWPWQISITKNRGTIPDPMIKIGNSGCDISFFLFSQKQFFSLPSKIIHLFLVIIAEVR